MADNVLHKVSLTISASLSDDAIEELIRQSLDGIDTIYSYLIYAKYKNDKLTGWLIEYNFSQIEKYNTLICQSIISELTESILSNRNAVQSVVAYKQPSIELMVELYKPLMSKLALEQCERWTELEYDDAFSMCQLTMLKLYKKGYYVHKQLLKRSFENYVLMELRHSRNKPEIISLEQTIFSDGDSEPLSLADMLPDKDAELKREQKEEEEVFNAIFEEVKEIIVEFIGERQFEQLLRDYGNKHTTPWSRKKMQQIKEKLKKLGITWESFRRYE